MAPKLASNVASEFRLDAVGGRCNGDVAHAASSTASVTSPDVSSWIDRLTPEDLDRLDAFEQRMVLDELAFRRRRLAAVEAEKVLALLSAFLLANVHANDVAKASASEVGERSLLIDAPEAARLLGISAEALKKRTQRYQMPAGSVVYTGRRVQYVRDRLVAPRKR